jgi:hypothetical protein
MENATARGVVLLQISRDEGAEPPEKSRVHSEPFDARRGPAAQAGTTCGRFASNRRGSRRKEADASDEDAAWGPAFGRTGAGRGWGREPETAGGAGTRAREGQQGQKPRYERRARAHGKWRGSPCATASMPLAHISWKHCCCRLSGHHMPVPSTYPA